MAERAPQQPDIGSFPGDGPKSWIVTVQRNRTHVDLSASTLEAVLTDDGVLVRDLTIDQTAAGVGVLLLTASTDLPVKLSVYSSWRLRESPIFNGTLVQGRLVRASSAGDIRSPSFVVNITDAPSLQGAVGRPTYEF